MGWKSLGGDMLRAPCQLSRVSENDHHKLLISSDSAFITDFSPHGLHLVQLTNYKANRERIFHFSWTTKCVYWVVSFFLLDPNVLLDHTSSCCLVHIQFGFFLHLMAPILKCSLLKVVSSLSWFTTATKPKKPQPLIAIPVDFASMLPP